MMSDVIKTISSHEEFLAIDFNNPPSLIIFEETLSFPLRPKQNVCDYKTFPQDSTPGEGNLYKGLKTVDSFPQKTREVYFHPHCSDNKKTVATISPRWWCINLPYFPMLRR